MVEHCDRQQLGIRQRLFRQNYEVLAATRRDEPFIWNSFLERFATFQDEQDLHELAEQTRRDKTEDPEAS